MITEQVLSKVSSSTATQTKVLPKESDADLHSAYLWQAIWTAAGVTLACTLAAAFIPKLELSMAAYAGLGIPVGLALGLGLWSGLRKIVARGGELDPIAVCWVIAGLSLFACVLLITGRALLGTLTTPRQEIENRRLELLKDKKPAAQAPGPDFNPMTHAKARIPDTSPYSSRYNGGPFARRQEQVQVFKEEITQHLDTPQERVLNVLRVGIQGLAMASCAFATVFALRRRAG